MVGGGDGAVIGWCFNTMVLSWVGSSRCITKDERCGRLYQPRSYCIDSTVVKKFGDRTLAGHHFCQLGQTYLYCASQSFSYLRRESSLCCCLKSSHLQYRLPQCLIFVSQPMLILHGRCISHVQAQRHVFERLQIHVLYSLLGICSASRGYRSSLEIWTIHILLR